MLEIRPTCEHCNKKLSNTSNEAMICTFECTFCKDCVDAILHNVCPNCAGGFTKRPTRPSHLLKKYPGSIKIIHKHVDEQVFKKRLDMFKNTNPRER